MDVVPVMSEVGVLVDPVVDNSFALVSWESVCGVTNRVVLRRTCTEFSVLSGGPGGVELAVELGRVVLVLPSEVRAVAAEVLAFVHISRIVLSVRGDFFLVLERDEEEGVDAFAVVGGVITISMLLSLSLG